MEFYCPIGKRRKVFLRSEDGDPAADVTSQALQLFHGDEGNGAIAGNTCGGLQIELSVAGNYTEERVCAAREESLEDLLGRQTDFRSNGFARRSFGSTS